MWKPGRDRDCPNSRVSAVHPGKEMGSLQPTGIPHKWGARLRGVPTTLGGTNSLYLGSQARRGAPYNPRVILKMGRTSKERGSPPPHGGSPISEEPSNSGPHNTRVVPCIW